PASEALVRSLNAPAVEMLRRYGVGDFQNFLQRAGMTTLNRLASDYGLSLILGGAEGRLDEITRMYAGISAASQGFGWVGKDWPLTDVCTLYYMTDVLQNLDRPDELDRSLIPDLSRIAWKTGTSYGGRDAWAVGITPDYAVGVWAGNASGASSPELLGARTAGPVLFDIFTLLPPSGWFSAPNPALSASGIAIPAQGTAVPDPDRVSPSIVWAQICPESGMLKSRFCPQADSLPIPVAALKSQVCPYHRPVMLSADGKFRLTSPEPGSHVENIFVLPPTMEFYYRSTHPEYSGMPPLKSTSSIPDDKPYMAFIYPQNGARIKIPPMADGSRGEIVASLAVPFPDIEVFWHIDSDYLGSTVNIHKLSLRPDSGNHVLTAVDENGLAISVSFFVE
ncbi:MAG: penicillin-binding protein 1C, partial [Candidatus Cryptobacteroides sp.]